MQKELSIFKALSDKTRLRIVDILIDGEKCVCEIFPKIKRTQSTTSIQLSILEKANILTSRKDGKKVIYKICDKRILDILKIIRNKKC